MMACNNVTVFMASFMQAVMPGSKFKAALTYGIAEMSASLVSGLITKHVKDTTYFATVSFLILFTQIVFYFAFRSRNDSIFALTCTFCTVFSINSSFCTLFLILSRRIPIEKLAGINSFAMGSGNLAGLLASILVYMG